MFAGTYFYCKLSWGICYTHITNYNLSHINHVPECQLQAVVFKYESGKDSIPCRYSNTGPSWYQSNALPIELSWFDLLLKYVPQGFQGLKIWKYWHVWPSPKTFFNIKILRQKRYVQVVNPKFSESHFFQ